MARPTATLLNTSLQDEARQDRISTDDLA